MNALDAIRARRSVRAFAPDPVPDAVVRDVVDAARWAPTSGNAQPWMFLRVRDPVKRDALVATTYGGYARSAPEQAWLRTAPELLLVCVVPLRTMARYGEEGRAYARLDVAAAVQTALIAATAYGLGSAWVGGFDAEAARTALALDRDLEPLAIVALGSPAERAGEPYRLPLEDVLREV